jgi:uncharacterized membrane protein
VFQTSQILAVSLFFHLLATTIWVGGLLITSLMVWPEARHTLQGSNSLYSFLSRMRQRFTPWGHFSLVVLIVTGLFQMSLDENYSGFLNFSNTWSVVILFKHIAIGGMIASGAILQYAVFPALERTTLRLQHTKDGIEEWETLRRREINLTRLNLILGLLVLAFSAWAVTL